MKIAGILMIIISTTAIGFKASEKMDIRIEQLREIRKIMILLRGEVMYNMSSIDEAFNNVAGKISEPFSDIMKEISRIISKKEGKTFEVIWKKAIVPLKKTCMVKSDIDRFRKFGEDFGCIHKEMQISAFDMYIEELENTIREADKKKNENSRLYRTLGIMSGLLIVIVII